jgi:hypothetical protein
VSVMMMVGPNVTPAPADKDDDKYNDNHDHDHNHTHDHTTPTPTPPIPIPNGEEIPQQQEDTNAEFEDQLRLYAERNAALKATIRELSDTNYLLKLQLDDFKRDNQGTVRILNLEEEVSKWETLFAETAEVGAAKMKHLEEELEQLRGCLVGNESATIESMEQMENVCNLLVETMEDMQKREKEFNDYKRKSTERITMLTEMLDYAKAEKEKEVEHLKRKQLHEYALMEKIENLEDEVLAKAAIIERERNQAMKREARLKEQLRKHQYSDPKPIQENDKSRSLPPDMDFLDSACTSLSIALEGAFHWCGTTSTSMEMNGPSSKGPTLALEEKSASE